MIEITPNAAIGLYLTLSLCLVLGAWLYQNYSKKKSLLKPPEKKLIVCEYCHFAYLDQCFKAITQCPQCQSYNRKDSSPS